MEALLILCGVAAWLARVPYIFGKLRIGKVLVAVPDRTAPQFTVSWGALIVTMGLLLTSGHSAHWLGSLRPYLGMSLILLGIALGLNFLFPVLIGTAGILDSFGGFASWENIESYSWDADGGVLELRLRRSILLRRRFLPIPARFRQDVSTYLAHRLWGAEEKQAPLPTSSGPSETPQLPPAHSFDHDTYNS